MLFIRVISLHRSSVRTEVELVSVDWLIPPLIMFLGYVNVHALSYDYLNTCVEIST